MKFANIPGHFEIKKDLISLVENHRLPHALIFTGPKGNGKLSLALALASYIQCKGNKESDKCGKCIACKKTDKLIHPDINFVIPTISAGKKSLPSSEFVTQWREMILENQFVDIHDWMKYIGAENKQPNIAKVSIEELVNSFNFKVFEGNKKISIIWYSEFLGYEGNRILKLIEEPPHDSLIILIAEDSTKVLPTILSRCQIIKAPPFKDEELIEWAQGISTESNLSQLVSIAEGNISSLNNLLKEDINDLFDELLNWFRLCYQGKSVDLVPFSDRFSRKSKDNQKYFFRYGLTFLEHVLKSYYLPREEIKLVDDEFNSMMKIRNVLSEEKIYLIIDDFNKNIRFLERNANAKLLIFTSSIKLHQILKS